MLQAQRRERHHTQFHVSQRPRQPRLTDALITHGDPITPRQTEFLARCGINPAILKGKGHACHVIDRIMQRRAAGLATYKKVRTLRKFGVPAPHLTSFNRASAILDLLFSERSSRGTRYA